MRYKTFSVITSYLLFGLLSTDAHAGQSGMPSDTLTLKVDVSSNRHPISPMIYGLNDFGSDPQMLAGWKAIGVPVMRWGGDAATRYNWRLDSTNSGGDWYFMAGNGEANPVPSTQVDAFINRTKECGGKAIVTIPIIPMIDSVSQTNCSFPVSLFGPQQSVNPYVHPIVDGKQTDAGNGIKQDGSKIVLTPQQMLRVNQPNSPAYQAEWVNYLVKKYKNAAHGGVAIFQMDNEPSGWSNTDRDIVPVQPGYSEIIARTLQYAAVVRKADPTASILGPSDFGWAVYKGSPEKHNGLWNAERYLIAMKAYQGQHGVRLLNYFDEHYYPFIQTGQTSGALQPAGDAASQKIRLESTRSLWDPSYVEKNWIGQYSGAIELIPRMQGWVKKYYPVTKTAITEYNWGGLESMNGALAEADVLGIFGRQGLDLATLWGPPTPDQPGAFAFRMYRDYNGEGGRFGSESVESESSNQDALAIYGAERRSGKTLTLMVLNKTHHAITSRLSISGFRVGADVKGYLYSQADLTHIVPINAAAPVKGVGSYSFPAYSITLLVMNGSSVKA